MAGFKTFVDLDILTAAEVNDFLMTQAVMVFADSTARTTALPTPSEGMVTYLADTNVLEKYSGASWVDITADSIAKAIIDAKGDLIVGTADNTPARLAVGTNDHVLTADSATATGLKWAAVPAPAYAPRVTNEQTANYTLVLADAGKIIEINSTSNLTVTVPTEASVAFAVGTQIDLLRTNTGTVTVAGDSGVTVNSADAKLKLNLRYSAGTLIKRATDTWVLIGDLAA
jgi:hypothetical protein